MITWPDVLRRLPFAHRKRAAAEGGRGERGPALALPETLAVEPVALWHDRIMLAAAPGSAMEIDGQLMRPADDLTDVNLIANPSFAAPAVPWRSFDDATRTGRDMNPALRIDGGHTGYFRLDAKRRGRTDPVYARYVDPDPDLGHILPVVDGAGLRWSALLAAQNAVASLIVEVLDAAGGVLVRSSAMAPTWASGGRNPKAYARVGEDIALPMDAAAVQLTLELAPLADADVAVALFSDVQLGFVAAPARPMADLAVALGPLRRALDASERALFTAPILPVPDGAAPRPVVLSAGDVRHTLAMRRDESGASRLAFADGEITVEPRAAAGRLALIADGVFVADIYGAPERPDLAHAVALPPAFFDGRPHTLELVSTAGCHARLGITASPFAAPWEEIARAVPAPLPGEGAPLAAHRYRALAVWAKRAGRSPWLDAHLGALHDALVAGDASAKPFPLECPATDAPDASIVVSADASRQRTFITLASLAFAPVSASFEVIVAAPEGAPLPDAKAVRVVRTAKGHPANAGAAQARGRAVVLLDAGVEVTEGWLDQLLAAISPPGVGIAGPKLLTQDGRLFAAGGALRPNLDAVPVGEGGNPFEPRYSYTRSVDFVPTCAVAVAADLWRALGGLSEDFGSRGVAGVDLALRARELGRKVRYVANAVAVAPAGDAAGEVAPLDLARLKRSWAHRRPAPVPPHLARDRDVSAQVLFALADMPRADVDAGSVAALEEIRMIQALGAKVTLVTREMAHLPRYAEVLSGMGVELCHAPFHRSMSALIAERGGEFDAVFATKFQVLDEILPALRRHAPQAKILLNLADLQFLRVLRAAAGDTTGALRKDAELLRARELATIKAADVVCTYSDVEASVITSHCGPDTVSAILPWVERVTLEPAQFAGREGIAFLGNYRHPPNTEAVSWFAKEVMPQIAKSLPDARFHVYGAYADELPEMPNAVIEGHAPDLKAMFDRHRIAVVPLRSGAGVKGKVFAALASGIPIVATPLAAEGIAVTPGEHALIASGVDDFAREVARLYGDERLWHRLVENGRTLIETTYDFEAGARAMQRAFEAAGLYLPLTLPR